MNVATHFGLTRRSALTFHAHVECLSRRKNSDACHRIDLAARCCERHSDPLASKLASASSSPGTLFTHPLQPWLCHGLSRRLPSAFDMPFFSGSRFRHHPDSSVMELGHPFFGRVGRDREMTSIPSIDICNPLDSIFKMSLASRHTPWRGVPHLPREPWVHAHSPLRRLRFARLGDVLPSAASPSVPMTPFSPVPNPSRSSSSSSPSNRFGATHVTGACASSRLEVPSTSSASPFRSSRLPVCSVRPVLDLAAYFESLGSRLAPSSASASSGSWSLIVPFGPTEATAPRFPHRQRTFGFCSVKRPASTASCSRSRPTILGHTPEGAPPIRPARRPESPPRSFHENFSEPACPSFCAAFDNSTPPERHAPTS